MSLALALLPVLLASPKNRSGITTPTSTGNLLVTVNFIRSRHCLPKFVRYFGQPGGLCFFGRSFIRHVFFSVVWAKRSSVSPSGSQLRARPPLLTQMFPMGVHDLKPPSKMFLWGHTRSGRQSRPLPRVYPTILSASSVGGYLK